MFPKALSWWVIHALPQNTVGEADFLISVFDVLFSVWEHLLCFTLNVLKTFLACESQFSCQICQWVMNDFKERRLQQPKQKQKNETKQKHLETFSLC